MTRVFRVIRLLIVLILISPLLSGSDLLEDFEQRYRQAGEEALAPVTQLKKGYLERLAIELAAAQEKADLETVRGIMAEIAWVEGTGKMPSEDEVPSLLPVRKIYLNTLGERELQRIERLEGVLDRAATALKEIEKTFIREGEIERAEATRAFAEKAREEIGTWRAALEAPGVPGLAAGEKVLARLGDPGAFTEVEGCRARESGGSWTLTSPPEQRGHLQTREEFEPPFRLSALVASESGDLRFYFGPEGSMEFVLFNWLRNPTVLRLADPTGQVGIVSVPDKGIIPVGETKHIEVTVEDRRITVTVDGDLRGTFNGDFGGYRAPVGIGPFGTETVPGRAILEHFTVIRPRS